MFSSAAADDKDGEPGHVARREESGREARLRKFKDERKACHWQSELKQMRALWAHRPDPGDGSRRPFSRSDAHGVNVVGPQALSLSPKSPALRFKFLRLRVDVPRRSFLHTLLHPCQLSNSDLGSPTPNTPDRELLAIHHSSPQPLLSRAA